MEKELPDMEPAVDLPGVESYDQQSVDINESAEHLPPLPTPEATEIVPEQKAHPRQSSAPAWLRSVSSVLVTFLTTGLIGYAVGIAGAVCLVTGVLDIDPAWIKSVIKSVKSLIS